MSTNAKLTIRGRILTGSVAALTALALLPAAASASATWFGSSLDHGPANSGSACSDMGVGNPGDICTHVGSYYPGFSGRARSPLSGTITKLKLRPEGPMTFIAKVVKISNLSPEHRSGQASAVSHSRLITIPGPTQDQLDNGIDPVVAVRVHLKVRKGQELAIDTASNTAEYCSDGTPGQLLFDPVLGSGQGRSSSAGVDDCLMLVQALVKR